VQVALSGERLDRQPEAQVERHPGHRTGANLSRR
jgi:hypothetical protein